MFKIYHAIGFTMVFLVIAGVFWQLGLTAMGTVFGINAAITFSIAFLKYLNGE